VGRWLGPEGLVCSKSDRSLSKDPAPELHFFRDLGPLPPADHGLMLAVAGGMNKILTALSNQALTVKLEDLIRQERRSTAEILEYIQEVDRRKLYLELGHNSLFSYLTDGLGYTYGSAQRRIDSARTMQLIPELKEDLQAGTLNMMQVSMVAHGIRKKRKEGVPLKTAQKRQLLDLIKNQNIPSTQKILAKALDIPLQAHEKERVQQDDSVRIELTLSRAQVELLKRVKELISHRDPSPSWADLISFLAEEYLKKNDPLEKTPRESTARVEVKAAPPASKPITSARKRKPIPMHVKRYIFQRDRSCQWISPLTSAKCGSRFQLQIDHKKPVWDGGGNEVENLQLLCSAHNAWKYDLGS
jgi:hypothetical protein